MSNASKRYMAGVVCVICVVLMAIGIARMIPYGLGGEISKAMPWIILLALSFGCSLPAAMAYYYFRRDENKDLEHMRMEVNALASAGQQDRQTKTPPPAPTQATVPKKSQNQ